MKTRKPSRRVKRLLRDKARHAFFKNGEWTTNPDIATDFSDLDDLLDVCDLYGVNDAEIVVHYVSGAAEDFIVGVL